jgi:hypothetical protein
MFHTELPPMIMHRPLLYGDFVAIISHGVFEANVSILAYNLNTGEELIGPTDLPPVSILPVSLLLFH